MKLSLALGPRQQLSRQTAWGCFTTNLAMPGFGSLLGGRSIGYFQIPFTIIGFGLSLIESVICIVWYAHNQTRLADLDFDQSLSELWSHLRWPLLGMAIFFATLLWAMTTSLAIMAKAREHEAMTRRI